MTVRLVAVDIQLHVVDDDGEHLTPITVQPIHVDAKAWPMFEMSTMLKRIEAELERSHDPEADTD